MSLLCYRVVYTVLISGCVYVGANVPIRMTSDKVCPSEDIKETVLSNVLSVSMPKVLQEYVSSYPAKGSDKERIEVSPGVHAFIGHSYANCVVLEAPEGLVIVDTLIDSDLANPVINQIREEIGTQPIKALIYTNMRPDHVGGAKAFVNSQPGQKIDVWSYRGLTNAFWSQATFVHPAITLRKYRIDGVDLPKTGRLVDKSNVLRGLLQVPANHMTGNKRVKTTIAGLVLQFYHLPGPTSSNIGVYIPRRKIFMIGDSFTGHFPDIHSPSCDEPSANILDWIQSLNIVVKLDIDILISARSRPVIGKNQVRSKIEKFASALKYIHDQTMRAINKGFHPQEIAKELKLPKSLINEEDLREFEGTTEWAVRGLYRSTMGWFDGLPENLFPLTPKEQALRWLDLMTPKRIIRSAKEAIETGSLEDLKWAVQLTSLLEYAKEEIPATLLSSLADARQKALIALAEQQTSLAARNYLLRNVLEDNCLVNNSAPDFTDRGSILFMPLDHMMQKLCVLLKAEKVEGIEKTILFVFTDVGQRFTLNLHHSLLDIDTKSTKHFDLKFSITSSKFREVLVGEISLEESGASVVPSTKEGIEFLAYFDDPTVSFF